MTEDEFWALTPYEFSLLLGRHTIEGRWLETMAAVQPMLFAEAHRDKKKRREPFQLEEFTITGIVELAQKEEAARKKRQASPEALWAKIGDVMRAFGGK